MSRRKLNKRQKSIIPFETEIPGPQPIRFLGEECIRTPHYGEGGRHSRFLVPPSSPKEIFLDYTIRPLPDTFPRLKDLRLPKIRVVGVKAAIETLSQQFKCGEFKLNLLQFWFLDMLADCLWRAQDDYQFPDLYQKIILEWVLYFFKLVRARNLQLSRKQILRIFREAMNLAENQVDAGVDSIPLPEKLFTLNHKAIEERDEDTESVTSDDILKANEELLVIRRGEQTEVYKLPPRGDVWDKEDECLSSSIETLSESSTSINEENYEVDNDTVELAESIASNSEDYYNFYKPDMRTPPRFKGSQSGEGSESYISLVPSAKEVVRKSNEPAGDGVWKLVPKKIPKGPCPSRVFEIDSDGEDYQPTAKEKEELVRQAWFEYYLWRLRRSNLEEEKRLTEEFPPEIQHMELEESEKLREAIFEKLNNKSEERKKIEENIFINNCVLMAIKEFVLDYFRESFQFNLIRWAYRGQHHLLTQELNRDWHIPKAFKGELKRPLSKKKKKEKPKKKPQLEKTKKVKEEKKEKKDKKEKKEKKGEKRGTSGGESGGRDDAKQEKKGKKKSKSDVESSGKDDDKKEKKGKKKGKSDGESSGKDDAKQEKKGKKMSKSDVASSGKDEDKKEMKSKKKGKSDGESSAKDDEKQEKKAKKKGKSVRESSGKDEELKEKKVKKRDTSDREISGTVGEKKDKKKGKDKKSSKGSEGKERYEEVKEGIAKTTKDNKGAKKSQKDEKAQKLQEEDKEQVVVDEPPQKTASAKLTPIRMVSDQLLREAKLKEAEEIQNEENRNYIFPLTKAVDNTFFQKIFVDWVAPRSKSTERIGSKVTIDDSGETKKKEKKREKKDVDKKSKDDKNEDEKEKDKKAKGKKEKKGTSDKRDGTGERGKKEKAKKSEKSSEKKSKKSEKGGKKKNKK